MAHDVTIRIRAFAVVGSLFTARCYASAVLALGLCPSVTSRCSVETAERIELGFGM